MYLVLQVNKPFSRPSQFVLNTISNKLNLVIKGLSPLLAMATKLYTKLCIKPYKTIKPYTKLYNTLKDQIKQVLCILLSFIIIQTQILSFHNTLNILSQKIESFYIGVSSSREEGTSIFLTPSEIVNSVLTPKLNINSTLTQTQTQTQTKILTSIAVPPIITQTQRVRHKILSQTINLTPFQSVVINLSVGNGATATFARQPKVVYVYLNFVVKLKLFLYNELTQYISKGYFMIKRLIYFTIIAFIFAGCGTSNKRVSPDFWLEKNRSIGVVFVATPIAVPHRKGFQGLLDIAINNANSKTLSLHLKSLELKDFFSIEDLFVKELSDRGLNVRKLDNLDLRAYQKDKTIDFRPIAKKEKIDTIIIFQIYAWGTIREYFGFIPLGSPDAYFLVSGYMFDLNGDQPLNLSTKGALWTRNIKLKQSKSGIKGKWDQPPAFINLTNSIDKNIEKVGNILLKDFVRNYK